MSITTIPYCCLGETSLESCQDYVVEFGDQNLVQEAKAKHGDIFTAVSSGVGIINFGNFIGRTKFLEKELFVSSWKISQQDYERMLEDLSEAIVGLPFDFDTPTFEEFAYDALGDEQILYHLFLLVRRLVLNSETSLEGLFATILSNPTRTEEREMREESIWEVTSVSAHTLVGIASSAQSLATISRTCNLSSAKICRVLSSRLGHAALPTKATSVNLIRTLDTPENRFLKFFLELCSDIAERFQETLVNKAIINIDIFDDCTHVLEAIQQILSHEFFCGVNKMNVIPAQSVALQKRNGYKEVLETYILLQQTIKKAILCENVLGVIENKDIALLYEMWTFFKTAKIMTDILQQKPKTAQIFENNDLEITLRRGISLTFPSSPRIKLSYNKSFCRGKGTYSLMLRPDVVLEVGESIYIFDAKFKLKRDFQRREDDVEVEMPTVEYKAEDIYKMHAYKDAIPKAKIACILYPNSQNNSMDFFEEKPGYGVGAIPLLPNTDTSHFENFIKSNCLNKS